MALGGGKRHDVDNNFLRIWSTYMYRQAHGDLAIMQTLRRNLYTARRLMTCLLTLFCPSLLVCRSSSNLKQRDPYQSPQSYAPCFQSFGARSGNVGSRIAVTSRLQDTQDDLRYNPSAFLRKKTLKWFNYSRSFTVKSLCSYIATRGRTNSEQLRKASDEVT